MAQLFLRKPVRDLSEFQLQQYRGYQLRELYSVQYNWIHDRFDPKPNARYSYRSAVPSASKSNRAWREQRFCLHYRCAPVFWNFLATGRYTTMQSGHVE